MTLTEVDEIFAYWERDPPAHLIIQTIARLIGWIPRQAPSRPPPIAEIAASAPPGLAVASGGTISMPEPVFDPETLRVRNRARLAEIARRNVVLSQPHALESTKNA